MYSASATFNTLIKAKERTFTYSGSIVTTGGTTYDFYGSDMRSGKLVRSIANNSIEVGSVYASELDCELALSISRYELYNGTITLNIEIEGASDVIPMGIFTISEISQTADRLRIKAYDNMTKFDAATFSALDETNVKMPYAWLSDMCTTCGVTLGNTSAQIGAMPNGTRKTGFADVVTDVKTMRDVLGYIATFLAGYAYIGRDGKLYIGHYGSTEVDTIPANFRYSSGLSDYRTTYDGLYAVYKNDSVQEYVSNTNSGGLVLDIGINPFLQFTDNANRQAALQEIIDAFDGVYYVPYSSEIPMNPLYDVGDVLKFTGNQADTHDYGTITDIVLTIGNVMRITCSGDNPRLAAAQDRFTKSVEGLSAEYSNGQEVGGKNFWLIKSDIIANNNIGSTKTQIAEIEFDQKTDVQRMGFTFTCDGDLSDTALIKVEITVDDEPEYTFEISHKYLLGRRHIPVTWGSRIRDKGVHTAKVYMTVTDSPLTWGELA
jgi:hypothetical protein